MLAVLVLSATSVYAAYKTTYTVGYVSIFPDATSYSHKSNLKTDEDNWAKIYCSQFDSWDHYFYFRAAIASTDGLPVTNITWVGEGSSSTVDYYSGCAVQYNTYYLWTEAVGAGGYAYLRYAP